MKNIHLQYFAILREFRGQNEDSWETTAATAGDLYEELKTEFKFPLTQKQIRVAINGEFSAMDSLLKTGDEVVYIPPVAGG
ncbi:MAG: MoaD/ThiS family protein [Opitutae bacterium]|jgi:molybdopterin converting factor small subunit|nr:MoaD/ThiS family protein [Opitutae bacterium]MBT4223907.1 MoaD/ThiS family protein [Opitutae bacterium]MBT5379435.1 MoaD/ThiS family protein [Opitutae bacterium]MBT5692059.1 MoaD/ThiS family protein [Opitutae bacterium]MBT6463469.1 MoaD/ThiS family protein [Opitutae bacterium]